MNIVQFLEKQDQDSGAVVGANFSNDFVVPVANSFGNEESIQFLACVATHCLAHVKEQLGENFDLVLSQVIENINEVE